MPEVSTVVVLAEQSFCDRMPFRFRHSATCMIVGAPCLNSIRNLTVVSWRSNGSHESCVELLKISVFAYLVSCSYACTHTAMQVVAIAPEYSEVHIFSHARICDIAVGWISHRWMSKWPYIHAIHVLLFSLPCKFRFKLCTYIQLHCNVKWHDLSRDRSENPSWSITFQTPCIKVAKG